MYYLFIIVITSAGLDYKPLQGFVVKQEYLWLNPVVKGSSGVTY